MSVELEETKRGPRERVLEAALELFVSQGYFNTNIPDISRLSRCSVGSIYHHFLNKEEIARDLYQLGLGEFRDALAKSLDLTKSLDANVHALIERFCAFAESHQLLARYLWLARHDEFMTQKLAQPTRVGFDSLGRKLVKLIQRSARQGEIRRLDAEIVWTLLFGIPVTFIRDWLDGNTNKRPTEVASVLADSCWAALVANR